LSWTEPAWTRTRTCIKRLSDLISDLQGPGPGQGQALDLQGQGQGQGLKFGR